MSEEQIHTQDEEIFDLDEMFSEIHKEENVSPIPDEALPKEVKQKEIPQKAPKPQDDDEEEEDAKPEKKTLKIADDKPEVDYKAELEKLQKAVKDTQRSFHEDRKKLSAYKKAVEKLKESGAIIDEEATMLLNHVQFENEPDEENTESRYYNIWDKEIEYMRKYGSNPKEIDQNISAFQHLVQSSSPKERKEIFDDLSQYEDDEVELTRQMLEVGRQYYEEIYSDIHEAGSIRNLKSKYTEREQELQKTIDKLTKQLNKLKDKHEDYDSENTDLKTSGGSGSYSPPKLDKVDLGAFFDSLA